MLAKMKKATVIGLHQNAEKITASLQDIGVVDIIELKADESSEIIDKLQAEKSAIINTLKILSQTEPEGKRKSGNLAPQAVIARVAEIRSRLEEIQEQRRKIQNQIETLEPLGEFDPQKIESIREQGFHIQFFKIQETRFDPQAETLADYDVNEISRTNQKVFFCTMGSKSLELPQAEEISLPAKSLNDLRREVETMNWETKELQQELNNLASTKKELQKAWISTENQFNYQKAMTQHVIEDELFYLQGWVPETREAELNKLSDDAGFVLHLDEPDEAEQPPTTHENSTAGQIGESLIYIYDTPAYRDLDPSKTVFLFFSIFFGMIIADVGYGLMLLGLTLALIRGKKHSLRLFRRLSITISLSTILFGILTASFFAVKIDPGTTIGRFIYTLAPLYRDTTSKSGLLDAMFISLWVGVINLSWVNLYKVIHDKKFAQLGWIPALVGLIPLFKILFGVELTGWEKTAQLYPLYGGILFVAVGTAIETRASFGGRITGFASSLYTVIQLIADMLSFLRIFALAMAGAKMAETFNMLFSMIYDSSGVIVGLILGGLVLIIGHVINLVLNIMGGVIHGLRLNFIESYHWCLDGGGKKYNPFRKLSR
ncbi:hypothetical protein JXJ21_00445 [candidate division KSB1 bacterium]|nr:hypothetical protein [candidate division KSB1 bacterium]